MRDAASKTIAAADNSLFGAASPSLEQAVRTFAEDEHHLACRVDRIFAAVMIFQWAAGVAGAWWLTPRTWTGSVARPHPHLWAAVVVGGFIPLLPIVLAMFRPGRLMTRMIIAVGQMLQSALLVHISDGRIETHFHVFVSLAFLSLYRDWRVLIPATLVVAVDHLARGALAPELIYGVAHAPLWRSLEHSAWVLFEDAVLVFACVQGRAELLKNAERAAAVARARTELIVANGGRLDRAADERPEGNAKRGGPLSDNWGIVARMALVSLAFLAYKTAKHYSQPNLPLWEMRSMDVAMAGLISGVVSLRHSRAVRGKLAAMAGTVEDLHRSEARARTLSLIASRTHNAVILTDPHGRIEWVNDGFQRLTGYSPAEALGRKPGTFLQGPETDLKTINEVRKHLLAGEGFAAEIVNYAKGGRKYWLSMDVRPIHDDSGALLHFMAIENDVTERKEAEVRLRASHESLRRAEEQYRGIFENAVMGIFQGTARGQYLSANLALAKIYGYESPEALLSPVHDSGRQLYVDPDRRDEFCQRVEKEGRVNNFELQIRRTDGKIRWIGKTARAVRGPDGALLYYEGTVEDVTERKLFVAHAKRAEKLALVASRTDNAVVITDLLGRIEWVNEGFTRVTGYTLKEVAGKKPGPLLQGPETDPKTVAFIRAQLAKGEGFSTEIVNYSKTKRKYWLAIEVQPVRDATGKVTNFIAIESDVTERKNAQAALQQAKETAEAASRAKSDFLANMSHEIRTPLNGVIGMTDLLLRHGLNDQQMRYARVVKTSAQTLLSLINDILDFSKIEAGKLELETADFALREALDDVTAMLAPRAATKGLEFACHVQGDVPDALSGDVLRLRQVLTNLISNAIKFTERGEVVVTVRAEEQLDRHVMLRVDVRDSGVGIPQDRMDRLFKSFSQVDASTTKKYGGTGLGLAISKQLVDLMGGKIGVTSTDGEGSTFWFTARVLRRDATAAGKPLITNALSGTRVLVVDDHAVAREILRAQLQGWKMDVETADGGKTALAMARAAAAAGRPHRIVILDQMMPGMSGLEVAAAMRIDPILGGVKLLMLTPLDNALKGDALRAAGFDGLLTKPLRQSQTFETVVETLSAVPGAAPARAPEAPAARAAFRSKFAGARVLLVEDNEVNQLVATEMLADAGFLYQVADDGHRALQILASEKFALILMDCQMPGIDGFETTRRFRKAERAVGAGHVPIVALTANAIRGDRERCLEAGMDAYVTKPIDPEELLQTIEGLLESGKKPHQGTDDLELGAEAPDEEPAAACPIDVAALMNRCNGKTALVEKLLNKFVTQVDAQVKQLRESLDKKDIPAFQRVAHTLKGSAANLSAEEVRRVAADLEKLSATPEMDLKVAEGTMQELLAVIDTCVQGIPSAIKQASGAAT